MELELKENIHRACVMAAVLLLTWAVGAAADTLRNVSDSGLALHGYDPVSYHLGKAQRGIKKISAEYQGITYFFSSEKNLKQFTSVPKQYLPAFGGWCAWAMLEGKKVDVDPERFKIVGGQTYLFYTSFFVDTLTKWNDLAGSETETVLTRRAQQRWQQLLGQLQ